MKRIPIILILCMLPAITFSQPSSYDWRNVSGVNYITSIKDQGACGDCWAFASTAAMEAQVVIAGLLPVTSADLSEQTLLSCSGAGTCSWGDTLDAASYLYNYGIPLETCFAYAESQVSCLGACFNYNKSVYKLNDFVGYSEPTASEIKSAIYTYGPVVVDMRVYQDFRSYTTGIYTYSTGSDTGGHDILLVGYNDADGGYFIVKNSWGTGWGESGFGKIAYSELASQSGTSILATSMIVYQGARYELKGTMAIGSSTHTFTLGGTNKIDTK